MNLDLDEGTLSFSRNGESQGTMVTDIPKGEYRWAISLYNPYCSATILSSENDEKERGLHLESLVNIFDERGEPMWVKFVNEKDDSSKFIGTTKRTLQACGKMFDSVITGDSSTEEITVSLPSFESLPL